MTTTETATSWAVETALGIERVRSLPSRAAVRSAASVEARRPRLDAPTRARRDAIVTAQVARETPWVMLALALLIVSFDAASAAAGMIASPGYYVSDVIQGVFLLVVVVLCRGRIVPVTWTPWLFAPAIVVNVAALSYQHTVDPAGNAIGVILMTTVLFGGLLAIWRPFLVSAAIIVALVTAMMFSHDPGGAMPWIIALLTGIGASAALLFARRRSATELAIAQRAFESMATHDQATDLLNRHGLLTATSQLRCLALRQGQPIFAVFVDVVGLKAVNDKHGHGTGDLVIARCADAVRLASRECDLVARWGGDEFVVIGMGPAPSRSDFARRISDLIDISGLKDLWSGSVSVGTASSTDADVLSVIDGADADMYASRPPCSRPDEYASPTAMTSTALT
jgi:diguanylate cyclase (GGDEF)-like protein